MLTIRQGHSEVRTRLPVLRMAVLITSMVTAVASIRMAVMKEEEWEDEVDWVRQEVPRLMAGVAELSVPLLAEVGVGLNWDEAH